MSGEVPQIVHWELGNVPMNSLFPMVYLSCSVQQYSRVLVTTWGHDPTSVFVSNLLLTVNDALTHSAVLIQVKGFHSKRPH